MWRGHLAPTQLPRATLSPTLAAAALPQGVEEPLEEAWRRKGGGWPGKRAGKEGEEEEEEDKAGLCGTWDIPSLCLVPSLILL